MTLTILLSALFTLIIALLLLLYPYARETGVIKLVTGEYVAYRQKKMLLWGINREYAKYGLSSMTSSTDWTDSMSSVISTGRHRNIKDAILTAEAFSPHKESKVEGGNEIVWRSSNQKKSSIPTEEELTRKLGEALIAEDKPLELKIMQELKQYKYI